RVHLMRTTNATSEISPVSLPDALPIYPDGNEVYPIHDDGREARWSLGKEAVDELVAAGQLIWKRRPTPDGSGERWVPYTREWARSEEHTSELQSRENLVCRLLLEKKKE